MTTENCVIIGASHAGVSLALQLRREGWTGGIQLLSAEPELPYHRPPLSKELLGGHKTAEAIRLRPEKIYTDNNIELLLDTEAVSIQPEAQKVRLKDGRDLAYSKLALCTGAHVRTLPLAAGRDNVFYIRTLADVARLLPYIAAGKRVVIIGAGYIGLEAAAQLVQLGLAVTVLEAADRVLQRVTAPVISDYYQALHAAHSVTIHTGVTITEIAGAAHAEKIVCEGGAEYAADFIIVGIGIVPNMELAAEAGLLVEHGILVDEFTRTSDLEIYAAGDCTEHPSALYGRLLHLESVQNATDQARVAAANICGKRVAYDAVPWFWSDQYDTKLQTAGVNAGHDTQVTRGDTSAGADSGFTVFYLKAGRVLAADCINRPRDFMASKKLVQHKAKIEASVLQDEAVDLATLV